MEATKMNLFDLPLVDGNGVTSRFVVVGTGYGRRVSFNGITISRFENGLIVEDWSVTDSLSMLRQLGLWRSILIGLRQWRTHSRLVVRPDPAA